MLYYSSIIFTKMQYPFLIKAIDIAAKASAEFAKGETLDNVMQKFNVTL